jgi:hypothetical protein
MQTPGIVIPPPPQNQDIIVETTISGYATALPGNGFTGFHFMAVQRI